MKNNNNNKNKYLQSNKISHTNTGQHMKNISFPHNNNKNLQFSKEIIQKMKCNNQKF